MRTAVASVLNAAGAVMVGSVVSVIVMTWVAVAVRPLSSVAVQVIVVSPSGNVAGASLVITTGAKMSDAVAVP